MNILSRPSRFLFPAAALLLTTLACHTATRTASVTPEAGMEQETAPSPQTGASDSSDSAAQTPPAADDSAKPGTPRSKKSYDNTIKWATASEVDSFGFDVYRGDSADGPFERLTPEIIEGGGTTDEPRNYKYVDDTIDPHRTYYYYVEAISMDGVRERFTPIGKAGPKIKPEDEAEPEGEAEPKDTGSPP